MLAILRERVTIPITADSSKQSLMGRLVAAIALPLLSASPSMENLAAYPKELPTNTFSFIDLLITDSNHSLLVPITYPLKDLGTL